jgi:hypothetical protein
MYKIKHDFTKNRLYLTLEGAFTLDDAQQCVKDVIAASTKLKRGYDVVNNISQLKVVTQEIAKEIEKVQAHFVSSGARMGVRIVNTNVISGMQFKRTAGNAGYKSVNVSSLQEAEELLTSLN